jgi:acetyl-CoA carboxylase alpha subunit
MSAEQPAAAAAEVVNEAKGKKGKKPQEDSKEEVKVCDLVSHQNSATLFVSFTVFDSLTICRCQQRELCLFMICVDYKF